MSIIKGTIPVSVLVIDDYYSKQEFKQILTEIKLLYSNELTDHSVRYDNTASNIDENGDPYLLANRDLFWLDSVYLNRCYSAYFRYYQKFQQLEKFKEFIESPTVASIVSTKVDTTLISVYGNNGKYAAHCDDSAFTQISYFTEDESSIQGGDIYFKDLNETVKFKNNRMIMFPGFLSHEVTAITIKKPSVKRYSISTFYNYLRNAA